jgi:hypothetical protein
MGSLPRSPSSSRKGVVSLPVKEVVEKTHTNLYTHILLISTLFDHPTALRTSVSSRWIKAGKQAGSLLYVFPEKR